MRNGAPICQHYMTIFSGYIQSKKMTANPLICNLKPGKGRTEWGEHPLEQTGAFAEGEDAKLRLPERAT